MNRLLSGGARRELRRYTAIVDRINALGPTYAGMSDDELAGSTARFRERLAAGEARDALLPDVFAAVRETTWRTTGKRPYDVQMMAGVALATGHVAQAQTGEGKTIAAAAPTYLMALDGKGSHVVTVNDYLAKRDAADIGRVHRFMGLTVGLLQNDMQTAPRKRAYAADVTYGTNTEFGFDYLRDNMATSPDAQVQRGYHYAIVDEADSILIDEARTPLIIAGGGDDENTQYRTFARIVATLSPDDVDVDEAHRTVSARDTCIAKVNSALGSDVYSDVSGMLANHLQQALKARFLFHRDRDYIVSSDGAVEIVDEFTGRVLAGRRYSDGLHQAIEAKEGVEIREENRTIASTTIQNYFRLYDRLAGMTGTALTEAAEFRETYGMGVSVIPRNVPSRRVDHRDRVFATHDDKLAAVVADISERHAKGQPVLVGTITVEASEELSRMLRKRGIRHEVLNAKNNTREAHIVAQAGRLGAVTVSTNMAGRGTDIMLGGNPDLMVEDELAAEGLLAQPDPERPDAPVATSGQRDAALERARAACATEHDEVAAVGGLCVIGTERHEARRIDDQLRGRAGRQGDPGETVFYVSMDDDLMRNFGSAADAVRAQRDALDGRPIESKAVDRAIERAQRHIEDSNFAMRRQVKEYDDVLNGQRNEIYARRNMLLHASSDDVLAYVRGLAATLADEIDAQDDETRARSLAAVLYAMPVLPDDADEDPIAHYVEAKLDELGEHGANVVRQLALRVIDARWMAYLTEMQELRNGIGLRSYGQRDPLVEYKHEAYRAFGQLVRAIDSTIVTMLIHLKVNVTGSSRVPEPPKLNRAARRRLARAARG